MQNEKFHIVYISDENYAMPTGISLMSLLRTFSCTDNLVVHIISVGVTEEEKRCWSEIAGQEISLEIIDKTEYVEKIKNNIIQYGYVSATSLLKFDIAEIINDVDKCLYLDGDIIVNGDLLSLFEMDLEDTYVAAVRDMGDVRDETNASVWARKVNLQDDDYFNSGMMLLNLCLMRDDFVSSKLLDYRVHGINFFMDQDALNVVLGERKKLLPFTYNFITSIFDNMEFNDINNIFFKKRFYSANECIDHQKILHMAGRFKPWVYYLQYFSEIFLKYYAKSPYKSRMYELKSPVLFLNKEIKEMDRRKEWKFPYDKIPPHSKIVIYGAGEVGRSFFNQLKFTKYCNIVLWCDRIYFSKGTEVVSPKEINKYQYDYVLVTALNKAVYYNIYDNLVKCGIPKDKIINWD